MTRSLPSLGLNSFYLAMLQVANFVLPMVTLPYLSRVLGPGGFGVVAYIMAIAVFLGLVCDYGFNWTALQEVSAKRHDSLAVRHIFSNVMAVKCALFVLISLTYSFAVSIVPVFQFHGLLSLVPLIAVAGSVFFPVWLFQGLERMRDMTLCALGGRLICVMGIFIFVRSENDLMEAALFQAGGTLVAAFPAMIAVWSMLGHRLPPLPEMASIKRQARTGFRTFVAMLAVNLYTTSQTLLVGQLGTMTDTGMFGAVDRCLIAGKSLMGVVAQAAMPRINYLAAHRPSEGIQLISRLIFLLGFLGLVAGMVMWFGAKLFVVVVFGPSFASAATLVRILSPVPVFLGVSTGAASLFMFSYGFRKEWSALTVLAAITSLITLFATVRVAGAAAAASFAVLASEGIVFLVSSVYFITRRHSVLAVKPDPLSAVQYVEEGA
jgi:PST family polysaccharide transporter